MPLARGKDARLHYSISGSGPETLLLVCGLGAHASEWRGPFLDRLGAQLRVVSMDNRAIELSETQVESWSMQDMADDVLAVIEAVGVERAHVLASSMGGMISQCLASAHPERVDRLVLMSTHSGGPGLVRAEPRAAETFMPAPSLSVGEMRRRALLGVMALGFPEAHPDVIDRLIRLREQAPTTEIAWQGQYAAIVGSDRSQLVGQIRARTLVLHGDLDPLIRCENGQRLAERIPGAKFQLLSGCGHIPYIEQPELSARAVLDFLQG